MNDDELHRLITDLAFSSFAKGFEAASAAVFMEIDRIGVMLGEQSRVDGFGELFTVLAESLRNALDSIDTEAELRKIHEELKG